jgi:hypothetical protein
LASNPSSAQTPATPPQFEEFLSSALVQDTLGPLVGGMPKVRRVPGLSDVAGLSGVAQPTGNVWIDRQLADEGFALPRVLTHELGHTADIRNAFPDLRRRLTERWKNEVRGSEDPLFTDIRADRLRSEHFGESVYRGVAAIRDAQEMLQRGVPPEAVMERIASWDRTWPGVNDAVEELLRHPVFSESPLHSIIQTGEPLPGGRQRTSPTRAAALVGEGFVDMARQASSAFRESRVGQGILRMSERLFGPAEQQQSAVQSAARLGVAAIAMGERGRSSVQRGMEEVLPVSVMAALEGMGHGAEEFGIFMPTPMVGAVGLPQVTKVIGGGRISPSTFTGGNARISLERALQSASPAELVSYVDDIGTGIVRKYGALENLPRNTPESFAISWLQVRGVRQLAELADKGDQAAAAAVARFVPEHQAFQTFKEISKGLQKEESVALGRMTSARLAATTTVREGQPLQGIVTDIIQTGRTRPLHLVQGRGRPAFDNALRNTPSENLAVQMERLSSMPERAFKSMDDALAVSWAYSRTMSELTRRAAAGDNAAISSLVRNFPGANFQRADGAIDFVVLTENYRRGLLFEDDLIRALRRLGSIE